MPKTQLQIKHRKQFIDDLHAIAMLEASRPKNVQLYNVKSGTTIIKSGVTLCEAAKLGFGYVFEPVS